MILKALLKPDAKKPPKGPITLLKSDKESEWKTKGYNEIVSETPNYKKKCLYYWEKYESLFNLTTPTTLESHDGNL